MARKILAITIALLMAASLIACTNGNEEESTTGNNTIVIPEESTTGTGTETGTETGNGGSTVDEAPSDYNFIAKNDTVYVIHENGAVNLRDEDMTVYTSVKNGTELQRIAISSDEANTWSKVIYTNQDGENIELYIYSSCLTMLKNFDEGFVAVTKTLHVNQSLKVRLAPDWSLDHIVTYLDEGDEFKVVAENTAEGWYKIECTGYGGVQVVGYISNNAKYFVETSTTAAETTTPAEETTVAEETTTAASK
jgi:hypothetical protein